MFHSSWSIAWKGVSESRDDRIGQQGFKAIGRSHAVEQAGEAEHGQRLGVAVGAGLGQPFLISLQHFPRGAVPILPRQSVGLFQVANAIDTADVAAVGVEKEPTQQREAQGVATELLAGVFQLLVCSRDLEPAQQADGDRPGQVVEVFPPRGESAQAVEVGEDLATAQHAETGIELGQREEQVAEVGIEQAAGLRVADRLLERLEAVEDQ